MDDKPKIKIIYLIADAGFSGGPIQLSHLLKNINRENFEPIVVAPSGFLKQVAQENNVEYHEFEYTRELLANLKLKRLIRKLVSGKTIIHCHGVRAGYFGRSINKSLKLPLIYTEHNWTKDYRLPQNWRRGYQLSRLKALDKYTTKTVAVSNAVKDFMVDQKLVPKDKITVIYNGVNFRSIKRRSVSSPVIIGTIASLHKRKGLVYLFEALSKLQKSDEAQKYVLKIVGSGPQEGFLKQHSVALGINFNIQWMGESRELKEFWSSINIYVQPSLDESFGMAVAEAMGYKIPVVSTTAGALPEIVGEAGLLVEPANSDQLVKAIQNIVNNNALRAENIESGYKLVRKNYTIERMVEKNEKLYTSLFI